MQFGESINLFYSSLAKDLSFYQSIPLMLIVTLIMVPLFIFMMSFLSLILFGYEFNFFHIISFKKVSKKIIDEKYISDLSRQIASEIVQELLKQKNSLAINSGENSE